MLRATFQTIVDLGYRPDKVVVDYDGDGSFMMTGNNLATAVDESHGTE